MYQLKDNIIIRLSDNAFIPKAEGNSDYHEYKKWIDEGNEPEIWQPPQPTLEQAKTDKQKEINNWADAQLKPILNQYPDSEIKSWPEQKAEAKEWLADNTTETPLLDSIAERRGIDKAELVRRVIEKAQAYALLSGDVIGVRQALEDQLELATTTEQVNAIELPA